MFFENLLARSDKMFHDHGDVLIKVFSVLVALLLLGLFFLTTQRTSSVDDANKIQQVTK